MVTIIEILGLNVIGIVSLLIAIYSIFGQKKLGGLVKSCHIAK